jgi:Gpi18-like mannosyltransferase
MVKRIGAIILVITTVFLLSTALAEGSAMPESSATVSTAAPENQASGDELVYNGDFSMTDDDGAPLGWIYDIWNTGVTNFEVVNDAQRGSCLYIDSAGENDAKALCELEVEPSSYYRLTCYVKAEEISADTDGANLSIFNTFTRSAAVYDTDGGWQQLVLTGKTGETQTTIQLAVRIGGYGSLASGKAWFTGVTMVRLDGEPAGEYADFATLPASDDENNNSDEEEAAEDTNYDILPGMTTILVSGIVTLALFIFVYRKFIVAPRRGQKNQFERIAIIFILAVMARLILSLLLVGHDTDLGCFLAWSQTVARTGFSGFYTSGVFADYTPGYMYVLWLLGLIPKLTGLSYGGWLYIFIIKLPAIACDLISAYLIYKLAKPRFGERVALGLLTLFALNPVAMFISGGWGQIDSIVALLMLLCFEAFAIKKKKILAAVIYGLAVLIKPQALMFGPLLAVAYIKDMLTADKKQWGKTPAAVVAAVATIYLLALPFQGTQEPGWILERYFSTATSYAYASIEAFNFFALIGANWKPVTDTILGIPYIVFGSVFIVLSATAGAILYCKAKDKTKRVLVLCAAFSMAAMYTFGQYMHERYIFVILLLLAGAFISYNDKRLFKSLMLFSITAMLNSAGAFQIVVYQTRGIEYQILTYAVSALEVGAFIYFAIACFDILIRGHIKEPRVEEAPMAKQLTECLPPLEKTDTKLNFTLRDKLLCCALTAVYAVIALIGLGTTTAPETYWRSDGRYQTITFTFDEGTKLNNIWMFNGLGSDANVEFISGDVTVGKMEQSYSNVYRWETLEVDFEGTQLTMEASGSDVWINELVFWGADGTRVQPLSIEKTDGVLEETDAKSDVLHLCDEPNEVPEEISYLYESILMK